MENLAENNMRDFGITCGVMVTVTVTVDSFSTPPLRYTTSKLGQIFGRTQGPEVSPYVAVFRG
jgi:hypothetical protein